MPVYFYEIVFFTAWLVSFRVIRVVTVCPCLTGSSERDVFLSLRSSEKDNFNSCVCGVCAQSSYVENADAHIDNTGFYLSGNTISGGSNVIIYGTSE